MNNELVKTGYIIKVVPYKENDAIVSLLTEEGIIVFNARGVLKPTAKNYASCLLFSYSEITLDSKNDHNYLLKGTSLTLPSFLYESLENMAVLNLISESIITFLGNTFSKDIYLAFDYLFKASKNDFILTMGAICLGQIIKEAGLSLQVNECVECGSNKNIVDLSFAKGGFLCFKCATSKRDPLYLKTMRYIFMVDEENYYHYRIENNLAITIIKELVNYLKDQFDYKNLNYFKIFNEIF